jgi:hypothetical protein
MRKCNDNLQHREIDQKVQVVLWIYYSPAEVLIGFDCNCCCCGFVRRQAWVLFGGLMECGTESTHSIQFTPGRTTVLSSTHHIYGGFAVAVPGLNQNHLAFDIFLKQEAKYLKGLARFLKVAFATEGEVCVWLDMLFHCEPHLARDLAKHSYREGNQQVLK